MPMQEALLRSDFDNATDRNRQVELGPWLEAWKALKTGPAKLGKPATSGFADWRCTSVVDYGEPLNVIDPATRAPELSPGCR